MIRSIVFGSVAAIFLAIGPVDAQEAPPVGDAAAGIKVFKRCMACHKVGPDARNGVGPALNGVVGRAAAAYPGYSYSAAMKNSGLVWNEATLTTYLQSPRKLVPGTKMTFAGLKKSQEIVDVIGYLKRLDAQGQQTSP